MKRTAPMGLAIGATFTAGLLAWSHTRATNFKFVLVDTDGVREVSQGTLIAAPAASAQPEGTTSGIASGPQQFLAYLFVHPADLAEVRPGEETRMVLDQMPSIAFHGRVSAISETPVELAEGTFYQVAFAVDDPAGAWSSSLPVHAHLLRCAQ